MSDRRSLQVLKAFSPQERRRSKHAVQQGAKGGHRNLESTAAVTGSDQFLIQLVRDFLSGAKDSSLNGLWYFDMNTQRLSISPADDKRLVQAFPLRVWKTQLVDADRRGLLKAYIAHAKGAAKKFTFECQLRADDSTASIMACGKVVAYDEVGKPLRLIGTFLDITQRKEEETRIAHMALHDPLTGLPNRRLFERRLLQEISLAERKGKSFAVLACDLDRFKHVNDSLGHQAGDTVLKIVAQRMREVVRENDTLARLGGDEFALVLHFLADRFEAGSIADRIISVVSQPIGIGDQFVTVGASIGVMVVSPSDAWSLGSADKVRERADFALYVAKTSGRNRFAYFDAEMNEKAQTKTRMADDLSRAVTRREFVLHFQPVVHARSGAICSFEALVRWQHHEHGSMLPSKFIPLAEETGVMLALGDWAISHACRQAATQLSGSCISVNLSAAQFRHPERLVENVSSALAEAGLRPDRLELEVNEIVLNQSTDNVLVSLAALRALGVRIALDKFGTGRSSLANLRSFPFDTIKIDPILIEDLDSPVTAAIVQAIIDLAHSIGAVVVAEGVATYEQLDWVRRAGCSRFQGLLAGEPISAHNIEEHRQDLQIAAPSPQHLHTCARI